MNFTAQQLLNDLFPSNDTGVYRGAKNYINVLWFLEKNKELRKSSNNSIKTFTVLDEDKWITIVKDIVQENSQQLKKSLIKKVALKSLFAPEELKNLVFDDEFISLRMKELVRLGASPTELTNKIVRYRLHKCLIVALELGADINMETHLNTTMNNSNFTIINFPMRTALMKKNVKAQKVLWDNPQLNRTQKDHNGYNIAHLAVKYKAWEILPRIWQDTPELFFEKNAKNENIFNIFANLGDKYFEDKKDKSKEKLYEIFYQIQKKSFHEKNEDISSKYLDNSKKSPDRYKFIKDIFTHAHHDYLKETLTQKEIFESKSRIKI